jgi:hypothetical protein
MMMPFVEIDIIPILTTIFWVWMLVDCITNKKIKGGSKICWLLLLFFTHIIGAVIYFFVASSERNPITAFNYYSQRLTQFFKQNAPQPTPTPQSYHYREYQQGYQQPQPTSSPQSYPEYQQGYQAQQPPQSQPPIYNEQPQAPLYTPRQPEYEEQLTISYPEMPQQHE